jgi:hypothetical protein
MGSEILRCAQDDNDGPYYRTTTHVDSYRGHLRPWQGTSSPAPLTFAPMGKILALPDNPGRALMIRYRGEALCSRFCAWPDVSDEQAGMVPWR